MSFETLTNQTWAKFYLDICQRFDDTPTVQFAYRFFIDGTYSNYSQLDMDLDWCLAMLRVCRKKQENLEVEIDILKLRKPVST